MSVEKRKVTQARFEAKKNFIESSAAYSLVVYFLQATACAHAEVCFKVQGLGFTAGAEGAKAHRLPLSETQLFLSMAPGACFLLRCGKPKFWFQAQTTQVASMSTAKGTDRDKFAVHLSV